MKPFIKTFASSIQPARCYLKWEDSPTTEPVTSVATPSPPSKKLKLGKGQRTLKLKKSPSPAPEPSPKPKALCIVDNNTLAHLIHIFHERILELVEQVKAVYPWFTDHAFSQLPWITQDLADAVKYVRESEILVSVMGYRDMCMYLPQLQKRDTYVLIKNLAIHHSFNILIDIDQEEVSVFFRVVHDSRFGWDDKEKEQGRIAHFSYKYGEVGASVDDCIFYEID